SGASAPSVGEIAVTATPDLLTSWSQFCSAMTDLQIQLAQESEVRSYLAHHPDLTEIVEGICRSARQEFIPDAALVLGVYRDPEIKDEYLSLCIRLASYPADVLDRIRAVSAAHDDTLASKSGSILVTTDFRPLR